MSHLGERLAAYVDGQLSDATRELVEAHIAQCPACRTEVDAEHRLKDLLSSSPGPAPSAGLLANLLDISVSEGRAGPDGAGSRASVRPLAGAVNAGGRDGRAEFVPTAPGLRPAVPGRPAPDPNSGARRRSMAAAGLVSVAAVTLGAALFGGEARSPRPDSAGNDVSAVRNTTNVPTDVAGVPAGALSGGLAAAGSSASGLGGWTFGMPGFGLAGFTKQDVADPADPFGWLRIAEPDRRSVLADRPFYAAFLPDAVFAAAGADAR